MRSLPTSRSRTGRALRLCGTAFWRILALGMTASLLKVMVLLDDAPVNFIAMMPSQIERWHHKTGLADSRTATFVPGTAACSDQQDQPAAFRPSVSRLSPHMRSQLQRTCGPTSSNEFEFDSNARFDVRLSTCRRHISIIHSSAANRGALT